MNKPIVEKKHLEDNQKRTLIRYQMTLSNYVNLGACDSGFFFFWQ